MQPEIKVKVGADTAEFDTAMARVRKGLVLFAGAATAAMAGLAATIKTQLDFADDMVKMSAKFGVPVETLTALKHAADLSGVSIENLGVSLGYLSRTMVDTPEKLQALGIAATDAAGNMRPTEDVLADLADLFSRMPDGALKTATAYDILGRSSIQLIPLLNGGAQALRDMMEEARALGIVIDEDTARSAEAFNDNLSRVQAAAKGLAIQLSARLLPTLERISQAFVDFIKAGGAEKVMQGLTKAAEFLGTAATVTAGLFAVRFVASIGAAAVAMQAATGVAAGLAVAMRAIPIVAIGAAVAGLVTYFNTQKTATDDLTAAQDALNKALNDYATTHSPNARQETLAAARDNAQAAKATMARMGAELLVLEREIKFYEERLKSRPSGPGAGRLVTALEQRALVKTEQLRELRAEYEHLAALIGALSFEETVTIPSTPGQDEPDKPILPGLPSPDDIGAVEDALNDLGRSAQQAFTQFLTGAKSAREALKGLLDSMASAASDELFRLIFGGLGIFSAPAGAPAPPLSLGGAPAPSSAPALSMPSVGRASGPASGGTVRIVVEEAPGFASRVRTEAQGVAVRVTQAGIREYDRMSLPQSVRRINGQPRMIGA